jgi:hypothetical protein
MLANVIACVAAQDVWCAIPKVVFNSRGAVSRSPTRPGPHDSRQWKRSASRRHSTPTFRAARRYLLLPAASSLDQRAIEE